MSRCQDEYLFALLLRQPIHKKSPPESFRNTSGLNVQVQTLDWALLHPCQVWSDCCICEAGRGDRERKEGNPA